MTQTDIVYNHMVKNGRITTIEAFYKGITRLSARIYDLKKRGVNIRKERVNYKATDGKYKHYDVYMLGKER